MGAQLWRRVLSWTLFAGSWWLVKLLQSFVERIYEILTRIDVDGDGASCDAASATLRAQVAAESRLAYEVRANNNLETAQVRKDTPTLIDVKGFGRPKELLHWPRGGFPTVVEEDGGILRWCDQGV